jgi:hypothetical protein
MAGHGTRTQLAAFSANDHWAVGSSYPYNTHESIMHWFVVREDGVATAADMASHTECIPSWPGLLSADVRIPFNVRKDRAARRIQTAWHSAIADPGFRICRNRLKREFAQLAAI